MKPGMKHLALGMVLAGLTASSMAAPKADPLSVVNAYMTAWSSNAGKQGVSTQQVADAANLAASYFDYEVEYLDSTVGTPQYGAMVARDNVIKVFLNSFPNARWAMTGPAKVKGETVEFDWVFTGNHTGPYINDATCNGAGEAISFNGHTKMVVKKGLIKYQNDSYKADDFTKQIEPSDAACKAKKAADAAAAAAAAK